MMRGGNGRRLGPRLWSLGSLFVLLLLLSAVLESGAVLRIYNVRGRETTQAEADDMEENEMETTSTEIAMEETEPPDLDLESETTSTEPEPEEASSTGSESDFYDQEEEEENQDEEDVKSDAGDLDKGHKDEKAKVKVKPKVKEKVKEKPQKHDKWSYFDDDDDSDRRGQGKGRGREFYDDEKDDYQDEFDDYGPSLRQAPAPANRPGQAISDDDLVDDGFWVPEENWNEYWPPTKKDGTKFTIDKAGDDEWVELWKEAVNIWKEINQRYKDASAAAPYNRSWTELREEREYTELVPGIPPGPDPVEKKTPRAPVEASRLVPRVYPYCVNGYLPKHMLPEKNRKKDSLPYLRQKETRFKHLPGDEVYEHPDLVNFIQLFHTSSFSRSGQPIISNDKGLTSIKHIEDGVDGGPYIREIEFTRVKSPDPKDGGAWDMAYWAHIFVKARVPLEGLYIQAIGYPNGLPFGEFRNDFDCTASTFAKSHKDLLPVTAFNPSAAKNKNLRTGGNWAKDSTWRNTNVPCRYTHMLSSGDAMPTVFAYGGSYKSDEKKGGDPTQMPAQDHFRTFFSWSHSHCNYKFRVQFLVLAVKSFVNQEHEVFMTPTYIVNLPRPDGVPYPYTKDWQGRMVCNESMVKQTSDLATDLKPANSQGSKFMENSPTIFFYDTQSSNFPIPVDLEYDLCVDEDFNFNYELGICPPGTEDPDLRKIRIGKKYGGQNPPVKPEEWVDPGPDATIWCLDSIPLPTNVTGLPNPTDGGGFTNPDPGDLFTSITVHNVAKCEIYNCVHPNKTIPRLLSSLDDGSASKFSPQYMESFYTNMARRFRSNHSTHSWSMVLGWFILMAIGTFTARYLKEAGGMTAEVENGCLGIGFWLWVHTILLLMSLTFIWVGLVDIASLRRKTFPCNLLERYKNRELKKQCRGRKYALRMHKRLAMSGVVFFHIALALAWVRPAIRFKPKFLKKPLPIRSMLIWGHVAFAYFGKFLSVIAVAVFLLKRGQEVCNDITIEVILVQLLSIIFFVVGCVVQIMEDKGENVKDRKVFPVPEAIEVNPVRTKWFKIKMIVVLVSIVFHFILFIIVCVSCYMVYKAKAKGHGKEGEFENVTGIFASCEIPSTASETEMNLQRFYYSRQFRA